MKNKLFISNIRKIKSSYKRFMSLVFLALLGVGFFAGIKATSPDMQKTLDSYLDRGDVYDVEVISTMGLTEEDAEKVRRLEGVRKAEPVKFTEELVDMDGHEKIVKIISLSDLNRVNLTRGHLPKAEDEIAVEKNLLEENNLQIGDMLEISGDSLKNDEFKIVGVVESPLYFSDYRGTASIGNGELNYFSYVREDAFDTDYYSGIYITLEGAKDLICGSDEYVRLADKAVEEIEDIKEEREQARFDRLYREQIDYMESMGMQVDLDSLARPVWYVFDRTNNQGYNTFIDATESLTQLGSVFPLVFYIVAILISLISMTRMIDEDRTEIGTLKGLGFSNRHIISKYIIYSALATVLGGVIGMFIGFNLLPRVIWSIYKTLFFIPEFVCEFNGRYAALGLFMALLCICGATVITAYATLRDKPSNLMRPKAPKVGKKILLEKIPFIWNRLKFSNKITIRNIFRYKKRIIVTIVGIAGSASLILVGFGLKDSVSNVVEYNYNNVFVYDQMISLKTDSDIDPLMDMIAENEDIDAAVCAGYEMVNLYNADRDSLEVNLVVPRDKDELSRVIKLNDLDHNKNPVTPRDNSVILSEKLARTLNVKAGDKVSFLVNDKYEDLPVKCIVENYVNDYAYITKDTYEDIFGEYSANVVFMKTNSAYDEEFDRQIMDNEAVSAVVSTESASRIMEDILSSINSVVVILIVSSATLAFVILYNLSTINISERKREISTLKVLGFYDEEVDAYITKENYFITFVGIAIGLVFGQYLSHYIISTCEPQYVMFIRHIETSSYLISAAISLVFTIIVNIITHYNLKKIDMVESLKSNE